MIFYKAFPYKISGLNDPSRSIFICVKKVMIILFKFSEFWAKNLILDMNEKIKIQAARTA